jgi:hypothetical protein
MLKAKAEEAAKAAEETEREEEELELREREFRAARRYSGSRVSRSRSRSMRIRKDDSFGEAMGKMVMKELTGTTGRRIVRGILGGLFKAR